jgi:hypothetical protein
VPGAVAAAVTVAHSLGSKLAAVVLSSDPRYVGLPRYTAAKQYTPAVVGVYPFDVDTAVSTADPGARLPESKTPPLTSDPVGEHGPGELSWHR